MKSKGMTHYCMDKTCDYEETNHKIRDAMRCPDCNGLIMSVYPTEDKRTKILNK